MKRLIHRALTLAALLALFGFAAPAWAAGALEQAATLGADGEAYLLKEGRYVELFPGGEETAAGSRVLALDVVLPGQAPQRLLVPGTEGTNTERSASLAYEDVSGTLYVLWQGWTQGQHTIKLARYADGEWFEPLELSGTRGTAKGSPQLVVTRESGTPIESTPLENADGPQDQVVTGPVEEAPERTILHAVWWEQAGRGDVETHYRPIIVHEGVEELGPEVILNGMVRELDPVGPVASSLARRPSVVAGSDPDSVVVSFADDATGALANLELRVLPLALGTMGDAVRNDVADNGHRFTPEVLGDRMRSHIIEIGRRMNPRDMGYLGDVMRSHIIEIGRRHTPDVLGDLMRSHIIEIGSRLARERSQGATSGEPRQAILEMGADMVHLISLTELRWQAAPAEAPASGEAWLFPSRDGMHLTLAWTDAGSDHLFYQASEGSEWSPAQSLELSEGLPLSQALDLVRQRASHR